MSAGDITTPNGTLIQALPKRLDTFLVRNHDRVHTRDCRVIRLIHVTPWRWAEGQSLDEIHAASRNGLKFCRICDPIEAVRLRLGFGNE